MFVTDQSRLNGCLLGGAVGDAFGAPIEAIFKLSDIRQQYGPKGLTEFAHYDSSWNDGQHKGLGIITDDTTMTACTLAGVIDALDFTPLESMGDRMTRKQWGYYLAWGQHQQYGEAIAGFKETPKDIPAHVKPFLFRCGAGRGTIAALLQQDFGTAQQPMAYDLVLGDKRITSPNLGSGAMMRIAPTAFLASGDQLVTLARENALMTHGHQDAINTAITTAVMVRSALETGDVEQALNAGRKTLHTLPQSGSVMGAWDKAKKFYDDVPHSAEGIHKLGRDFEGRGAFMALPIFSQVVYTLHEAATRMPNAANFKRVIRLAANHGGDSDTVAAIAGNIVGAAWGQENLPKDWLEMLMCKDELVNLGNMWHKAATKADFQPNS